MRINSISFKNYRCFLKGRIDFPYEPNKNMTVLVGPNGGGKTETLFAFWWTLYDYDFSKLTNKENTPYALNSGLYRELEQSPVGTTKKCSVTMDFEDNGVSYIVKKWCEYKKTEKQIRVEEYREFSHYESNGELSLPIRDSDEINKRLNRIIPKTILYGIVFDGERMQKLNTADENSLNAIKGVLSDITNVELLEKCSEYFASVKRKLNKALKQYEAKAGTKSFGDLVKEIENLEKTISKDRDLLSKYRDEFGKIEARLEEISALLEKNEEVKSIERDRKEKRESLSKSEKTLDVFYKNFSATLRDGYLLATENLLSDVENVIKKYDVPQELTVPAVLNILKRPKCICGREMDHDAVEILNKLISILPPDNINSTIAEMVRQLKQRIIDVKEQAKANYQMISDCEREISNLKQDIASLSARITSLDDDGSVASEAIKLEMENKDKIKRHSFLEISIPSLEENIKESESDLKHLTEQRDATANSESETGKINQQVSYIEKCERALGKIKEINKETALLEINKKIGEAYERLSEDATRGRKIRIVQYNSERRYQIVVYMSTEYDKLISEWKKNGVYEARVNAGISEPEIEEEAILACRDANSTGQSKINTFAFVKAILDYSNAPKMEDGIEIRKDYPLLIDAPFGDISDGNLSKSSQELHNFANQVILMIDGDKFNTLRSAFDCYTVKRYLFTKADNSNYSTISEMRE
ncbi:MAG: AAA family ATPase [Bacilli bacterium]|nr:AAA family ATPase [Bacilli bacterium]